MSHAQPLDPVALTTALVRCPSVTPADAGALDIVQGAAEGLGFTCERLVFQTEGAPAIDNLFARIGTGSPHLCFAGHTDVVPPGDVSAWSHPPFGAVIADGRLYGRGSADMKSGVATFLAAASSFLAEAGPAFGGSISLVITGDEEADALDGTKPVVAWMRDQGIVPDACLIGEPTSHQRIGDAIKIGRRGSLTADLEVRGVQGHTAYPHLADNPLPRLVGVLGALTAQPLDSGSPHFPPSTVQITTIDVGNPASNVIPAAGRARINIRFNDHHTVESLQGWMRRIVDDVCPADTATLTFRQPSDCFFTGDGPLARLVAQAVESVTGRAPALDTTGGTSDARFLKDLCPVVEVGLRNATIHRVDVHVVLDDVHALTAIHRAILTRFFAVAGGEAAPRQTEGAEPTA